jgi:hypothetical protein
MVSDEVFDFICVTADIPSAKRTWLRENLDGLVAVFADEIRANRLQPTQQADTDHIKKAWKSVTRARAEIARATGPAARLAFRASGRRIGSLVAASWLRRRFPDDRLTPNPYYWPRDDNDHGPSPFGMRTPVEADDISLAERIFFAERRTMPVMVAILDDIGAALKSAQTRIVAPPPEKQGSGGRKPLITRRYGLVNLAEFWCELGRRPTTGRTSKYGAFCEMVFDGIGWPTTGVNAALADAITTWRKLHRS